MSWIWLFVGILVPVVAIQIYGRMSIFKIFGMIGAERRRLELKRVRKAMKAEKSGRSK